MSTDLPEARPVRMKVSFSVCFYCEKVNRNQNLTGSKLVTAVHF